MRFSTFEAAATALLAGVAVADPLTVINPCPGATSTTIQPITVTKQYQEVSTCATVSACFRGSCVTRHPFETFAYVSTVIPAAWDGSHEGKTAVTSTAQPVTVSRFQSTLTKWVTPTAVVTKDGTTSKPGPTPIYLTIAKDFLVPYNKLGPLAIPGYDGSGLCKECDTQPDGSRSQVVDVVECRAGPGGSKCMAYAETWISKPAPSSSATTVQPVSTRFVAPSAGTYTFTFPFMAPAKTITAGTTTITVAPAPYYAHVTRVCHRARQTIDVTTTITKTIYWTAPCSRQPPTTSSAVPVPTGKHGFPGWPQRPGNGNNVDNIGDDAYDWADWGSDDVTSPVKPIPGNWGDWVVTNTETVTDTVTISPTLPTTSVGATTTSSSSSSQGPIEGTTTTETTTTFGETTTSTTSSFSSQGPIEGTTTTETTTTTAEETTTTTTAEETTTTSFSSSSSQGPIEGTTTTETTTTTAEETTTTTTAEETTTTTTAEETTTTTTAEETTTTTTAEETTTTFETTTTAEETTTTTITSFTSTTASITTTAETTTTSLAVIPVDPNNFVVGVNSNAKYHKRALQYLRFDGEDAVLTPFISEAAAFQITDEGILTSGGLFVDADSSQPFLPFSLTATLSINTATFSISLGGALSMNSANLGFCVTTQNEVFILFSSQPSFTCVGVSLVAEDPDPTATTTTTASPTTTLDPSGDLDADVPAPTNVRRGVQYGGRKFGHRRH
ncbi:hypothetical protein B0A52_08911 [Exophiala mesophila]|uniref:DUF7908 domain-containing protein n=1 Tax=Exophiala mesophila TaxID=212818 RepID=A0A438MX94_EXOME|nr:hypothetical protein B0A52_08911 [Exophiala mesophila]